MYFIHSSRLLVFFIIRLFLFVAITLLYCVCSYNILCCSVFFANKSFLRTCSSGLAATERYFVFFSFSMKFSHSHWLSRYLQSYDVITKCNEMLLLTHFKFFVKMNCFACKRELEIEKDIFKNAYGLNAKWESYHLSIHICHRANFGVNLFSCSISTFTFQMMFDSQSNFQTIYLCDAILS